MKTYLITGATSGIGLSLTKSFVGEDVCVIAVGRNEEKLNELKSSLEGQVKIIPVICDLENVNSIIDSLSAIKDFTIDGFIHGAGFESSCHLKKVKYDSFLKMMNVNFFSFVEILRLLTLWKEKEKSFRVVAMSSAAAKAGGGLHSMYSSSKGALESFVRSISHDLIDQNVEINALQPVYINTPMVDVLRTCYADNFEEYIKSFQPLGLIPVEDIVEQIRFLLFKKSKTVTGTTISINAGRSV